jgi:multidrug efflux pump subunit AcrA (membrane-fusion protein)
MQSTRNVSELLEKKGEGNQAYDEIAGHSYSEFDKVHLALMSKHNLVHFKAPSKGILISPPKSGDEKINQLNVGSAVKTGQVLALLGDMRGIRIDIDVPEIDMNVIQQGMSATIRGIAFGKHTFLGELVAVNAQASNKNNGMLPSFTAIVEVKHLDKTAQNLVKVGMSAIIELNIKSQDKLLVPIQSLTQHQGQTWLKILSPTGITESRIVTTGAVDGERVVIEDGLHPGETILYEE